jgi:hypothetical protein
MKKVAPQPTYPVSKPRALASTTEIPACAIMRQTTDATKGTRMHGMEARSKATVAAYRAVMDVMDDRERCQKCADSRPGHPTLTYRRCDVDGGAWYQVCAGS